MNKKVAAFALAIFAAQTVYAEVEFSGFVDMSVFSDDGDASMSLDQFELDASTDLGGGISMRADVNALGPTAPVELEQAFITYDTGEGLALTVGKFLSCTGFEAAEPTGMYQFLKILAVWVLAAGAAGADTWDEEQLARLASGDDAEIRQAVAQSVGDTRTRGTPEYRRVWGLSRTGYSSPGAGGSGSD